MIAAGWYQKGLGNALGFLIGAKVPPPYLLVLLAAGPAAGLVCMKSLLSGNRVTPLPGTQS